MAFGYSVGDFVVLGQLAWNIYKACKDSPQDFKNASQEVLSLHVVLKEVEETYSEETLSADQQSRLRTVVDGCRGVLEDLQGILDKYNSLGTNTKRTWDRLGWGSKDIATLRSRLISNTVLLTTFVNTSQPAVQKKLDAFMQEFRDGKREGSIVSAQTADSLPADEKQRWRIIRKDLEEIGICAAAFDANKDFIMNWFKTAIWTGVFELQTAGSGPGSISIGEQTAQDGSVRMPTEGNPFEDPEHESVSDQSPLEDPVPDTGSSTSTSIDLRPSNSSAEARTQRRGPSRCADLVKRLLRDNKELFKAVQSEDETRTQQLLEKGVDINVKDHSGELPLHYAVSLKSEVMVGCLLEKRANVNAKARSGSTALYLATTLGQETIVQLLLIYGANIDATSRDGITALHAAAERGDEILVQLLLKNGAKISEKARDGYTALHTATKCGHETIVQLLLENGAQINEKDRYGYTVLHIVAECGHETVVQLLLEKGAEINETNRYGGAALHQAAASGHKPVVQALLRSGAKVDEKNRYGYTALELAKRWKKPEVAEVLRNAGVIEG